MLTALEKDNAKEAFVLKKRIVRCEQACQLMQCGVLQVSHRDLRLALVNFSQATDFAPPLEFQCEVTERKFVDSLKEFCDEPDQVEAESLLQPLFVWRACDGAEQKPFNLLDPKYHELLSLVGDLQMEEDDKTAALKAAWTACGI